MQKSALVILLALSGQQAMADETQTSLFEQLDTDKSGSLSKEEASQNAALASLFDKLDSNQDGQLSPAEFSAIDKL